MNTRSRMTRELVRHKYHRERLEYNEEIGNQMTCKRKRCGSQFVKRGIV